MPNFKYYIIGRGKYVLEKNNNNQPNQNNTTYIYTIYKENT